MDTAIAIDMGMVANRKKQACGFLVCMVSLCLTVLGGGLAADTLERTDTWEGVGTAGWTNQSEDASVSNPGGYLNMEHHKLQAPFKPITDVARLHVPAGLVPTNLSFRFEALDVLPSEVRLCIGSRRQALPWYVSLGAPERNVQASFSVPVVYAQGWLQGPGSARSGFEDALHSVGWVGVYIMRHGAAKAQNYAIDDFVLQGLGHPGDGDVDGIPDAYEHAHGLDPDDWTDAAVDSDGDGMSNYGEYRAGTDATNVLSWFGVEVYFDPGPPPGPVVRWMSISNRTYAVWRSSDLVTGFTELERGIDPTPPINEYEPPFATNGGPYFYRVEVEE